MHSRPSFFSHLPEDAFLLTGQYLKISDLLMLAAIFQEQLLSIIPIITAELRTKEKGYYDIRHKHDTCTACMH